MIAMPSRDALVFPTNSTLPVTVLTSFDRTTGELRKSLNVCPTQQTDVKTAAAATASSLFIVGSLQAKTGRTAFPSARSLLDKFFCRPRFVLVIVKLRNARGRGV